MSVNATPSRLLGKSPVVSTSNIIIRCRVFEPSVGAIDDLSSGFMIDEIRLRYLQQTKRLSILSKKRAVFAFFLFLFLFLLLRVPPVVFFYSSNDGYVSRVAFMRKGSVSSCNGSISSIET